MSNCKQRQLKVKKMRQFQFSPGKYIGDSHKVGNLSGIEFLIPVEGFALYLASFFNLLIFVHKSYNFLQCFKRGAKRGK